MYLIPLIRANRALAASLIYPNHPMQAIAISEITSLLLPLFNPKLFSHILGTIIVIMYEPKFANYYIKRFDNLNAVYNQAEICSLLLFVLTLYVNNI